MVIVLGLLWLIFGDRARTTTATRGTDIHIQPIPPPTTPITPRAPQ